MSFDKDQERREVASTVLRMFARQKGRDLLAKIGWTSGQQILPLLPSDTMHDVLARIVECDASPAFLALRPGPGDSLQLLTFSASPRDGLPSGTDMHQIDPRSTVGMFAEYLNTRPDQMVAFTSTWANGTANKATADGDLVDA